MSDTQFNVGDKVIMIMVGYADAIGEVEYATPAIAVLKTLPDYEFRQDNGQLVGPAGQKLSSPCIRKPREGELDRIAEELEIQRCTQFILSELYSFSELLKEQLARGILNPVILSRVSGVVGKIFRALDEVPEDKPARSAMVEDLKDLRVSAGRVPGVLSASVNADGVMEVYTTKELFKIISPEKVCRKLGTRTVFFIEESTGVRYLCSEWFVAVQFDIPWESDGKLGKIQGVPNLIGAEV